MNELFRQCLEAAGRIVAAEKELYPGCEDAVNFDFDVSQSETDQSFQRTGTSQAGRAYTLPSGLGTSLASLYSDPAVTSALSAADTSFLSGILGRDATSIPGSSVLDGLIGLDSTGHTGKSTLDSIISQNPYSNEYETATQDLYERSFDKARSVAQSGPNNVRGGTARQGFELGEVDTAMSQNRFKDIKQQQQKDAGVVSEATQLANAIEASRRGTTLGAVNQRNVGEVARNQQGLDASGRVAGNRQVNLGNLALASEVLGNPQQTTTDNLTGKGSQIQTNMGVGGGLSCCFIFLEVLNGKLPWYVREGREEFCTPDRRNGYNWLAKRLVPWMKKYPLVKGLVNLTMVKPFLHFGAWYYGDHEGPRPWGWLKTPIIFGWFLVWDFCGVVFNKEGDTYGRVA